MRAQSSAGARKLAEQENSRQAWRRKNEKTIEPSVTSAAKNLSQRDAKIARRLKAAIVHPRGRASARYRAPLARSLASWRFTTEIVRVRPGPHRIETLRHAGESTCLCEVRRELSIAVPPTRNPSPPGH